MRRILSIILCILLIFAFTCTASAAAAEVRSLKTDIIVLEDGSCSLTMNATVRFLSATKQFYIPLATDADDINVTGASYDTESVSGVECVIFESKHGFTGEMNFVISYTLPNVVAEQENGSQLFTMKLPELGWQYPIAEYEVSIAFPTEVTEQPSWYSAYHGVDIENYLDISIQETGMHIRSFERLKDQEVITMELSFEPDSFELYHLPGQTVSVASVLFWLLLAATLAYYFLRLRRKRFSPSLRQTTFNDSTAGEIPCQLSGQAPDAVGILAYWGNLGYLSISRSRNGRILLHKQMEMGSERAALERKLFYSLFRSSDSVDAASAHVMRVSQRVGALIQRSWSQRLFRKNSGSPYLLRLLSLLTAAISSLMTFDLLLPANLLRWFLLPILIALGVFMSYMIWHACHNFYSRKCYRSLLTGSLAVIALLALSISAGSFFVTLCSIALQIFCAVTTMFGGLRVKAGEDIVKQILGLRAFLKSARIEQIQRLIQSDSQYFYRMLPFAEQLGVASNFAARCNTIQLEPCPWLIDSQQNPQTASEFYAVYAQIAVVIRKEQGVRSPTEVIYG